MIFRSEISKSNDEFEIIISQVTTASINCFSVNGESFSVYVYNVGENRCCRSGICLGWKSTQIPRIISSRLTFPSNESSIPPRFFADRYTHVYHRIDFTVTMA